MEYFLSSIFFLAGGIYLGRRSTDEDFYFAPVVEFIHNKAASMRFLLRPICWIIGHRYDRQLSSTESGPIGMIGWATHLICGRCGNTIETGIIHSMPKPSDRIILRHTITAPDGSLCHLLLPETIEPKERGHWQ